MPQRTNEFQKLVFLIEQAAARAGARVTESALVVDKITGATREVDVLIQFFEGPHAVTVAVECTSGERPATVEWVEQMFQKHSTLPTDKLVLVARAGFTDSARTKATWLGIDHTDLRGAEGLDWTPMIGNGDAIPVVSLLRPYATKVKIVFDESSREKLALEPAQYAESLLADADGNGRKPLAQYVDALLASETVLERVIEAAEPNANSALSLRVQFKPPRSLVDPSGITHIVHAVEIDAKCRKEVAEAKMERAVYGRSAVAYGSTQSMGKELDIVFAEQTPGEAKGLVRLAPPKPAA